MNNLEVNFVSYFCGWGSSRLYCFGSFNTWSSFLDKRSCMSLLIGRLVLIKRSTDPSFPFNLFSFYHIFLFKKITFAQFRLKSFFWNQFCWFAFRTEIGLSNATCWPNEGHHESGLSQTYSIGIGRIGNMLNTAWSWVEGHDKRNWWLHWLIFRFFNNLLAFLHIN